MSQGLWQQVQGLNSCPTFPREKDEHNAMTETQKEEKHEAQRVWDKEDGVVLGHLVLRLGPHIQQAHAQKSTSNGLWDSLLETYGKHLVSNVFKDFKDSLNACISVNQSPATYFNKLYATFAHMKDAEVEVPQQLQAMTAMATLPQKWEMLISIITGDNELAELELYQVC